MKIQSYAKNLPLFHIIASLVWGRFFVPVLALFYIASEVSYDQFTVIMALFSLTILLLEVPSGAIADLLGRKKTLIISRILYVVEVAILAFGNGFVPFLIAKIISGVAVSLSSGTSSALVYETLKKLGREKEHNEISGKISTTSAISMAFVFVIGAFLFSINPKLPAFASLPFLFTAVLFTFFLRDPYISHTKLTLSTSYKQFKEGFKFFFNNEFIIYLTLFTVFTGATLSVVLSISSVYFEEILIPVIFIGVVQFIGSLIMAYGSKKAVFFEKKYGEKKSFFSLLQFTMLSTLTMALSIPFVGILFYFLIPLVTGMIGILTNNIMNKHVKDTHRATMLSVKSLFGSLAVFIVFPIVGYLQLQNFSYGFIFLFLIMLVGALIAQRYANNNKLSFSS